jgi:hypothetical protein
MPLIINAVKLNKIKVNREGIVQWDKLAKHAFAVAYPEKA